MSQRWGGVLLAGLLCAGCGAPAPEPPAVPAQEVQAPRPEPIAPASVVAANPAPLPVETSMAAWQLPPVVVGAGQWNSARRQARQAIAQGRLYEDGQSAVPLLLAMRQLRPGDRQVVRQLAQVTNRISAQFDALLQQPERQRVALAQARQRLQVLAVLPVDADELAAREAALAGAQQRLALNRRGEARLRSGQLGIDGPGALADFHAVLEQSPGDVRALQGVAAVESALLRRADQAAQQGQFSRAQRLLSQAAGLREPVGTLDDASARIELLRSAQVAALLRGGLQDIQTAAGLRAANEKLARARSIALEDDRRVSELARRIELATRYGLYGPGQALRDRLADGGFGPQMVVVPHGQYSMGADAGDSSAAEAEGPAHPVRFERGFAISATEVSVAEFGRFVQQAGARPRATRRGHSLVYELRTGNFTRRSGVDWRSDYTGAPAAADDPVMHVSVRDAEAYAAWLSERSGQYYRLPSEAEFEYVLRAGRSGRYPWGDAATPPPRTGNLTGDGDVSPGGRRWSNAFANYSDGWWGAAPVARFSPNPWGVYDMEGNLSEWVADCWHASYRRAPADGQAWYNPGCRQRVVRGGNWANAPVQARAAWRWQQESDVTNARIGFRLVRGL